MTQHLVGKAEYQVDGDVILASVSLYDDVSHSYHPERVKRGTFKLLRGNAVLMQRSFDARFGNSEGDFHTDIAHPLISDNLVVAVNVILHDDTSLTVRSAVTRFEDTQTEPPLADQPEVPINRYGLVRG